MGLALYFFLMFTMSVAIIRNPACALAGILSMFAVEQWGLIYVPFIRSNGQLANLFVIALVCFAIVRTGVPSLNIGMSAVKQRLFIGLLLVYTLTTLLWTPSYNVAVSFWGVGIIYMLLYVYLAPMVFKSSDEIRIAFRFFLWFSSVLMLLFATVPDWAARALVIEDAGYGELDSNVGLPLALSKMAGISVLVAVFLPRKTKAEYFVALVSIVSSLTVILNTGTRAQLLFIPLAVVASLPIIVPHYGPDKFLKHFLISVVGITVIYVIFVTSSQELSFTGISRWQSDKIVDDFVLRYDKTILLLEAAFGSSAALLFGLGSSASSSLAGGYPHNVPMEILGEEGIIGFLIFLAILQLSFSHAYKTRRLRELTKGDRQLIALLFSGFIYMLLLCCKQGTLASSGDLFLYVVILEKYRYLLLREKKAQSPSMRNNRQTYVAELSV